MSVSAKARELHDDALVIDTHNDTTVNHIRRGGVSLSSEDRQSGVPKGTVDYLRERFRGDAKTTLQINFPKMREGGINAAFFAVDCTLARNNHLAYALDALGTLDAQIESSDGGAVLATSASDIRQAKLDGKLAVVMVIENSDGVEGSLNILRCLHRVGVRSIGLTHNTSSWAADGNDEARSRGGLTTFGITLIKEMNRLGMLIDVSHISEPGFWDVI
jgi:membrane dipeptidase